MDLAHDLVLVKPNVRAKRATAVARQARAVENATAPRTGPGGLPLALRLSEGLGISSRDTLKRMDVHAWDSASRSALEQEQSRYPATATRADDLAWRSALCSLGNAREFRSFCLACAQHAELC